MSSSPFPSSQTWFKLPAHSAAFIGKELEDGDKIILPPSVLHNLLLRFHERSMPHPLIFELNNNAISRSSHCGVLEFSAPDDKAYLPHWLMENLCIAEGKEVRLRVKSLPKALEVVLQPVEWTFTELPTPKESLEYALRNFTALTVGDTIRIQHLTGAFHLHVKALQPVTTQPAAGSVVNTSVAVTFEEPVEQARKGEALEELKVDEQVTGEVDAESYHYYRLRLDERHLAVRVTCTATAGAPDVYVSTAHSKPSIASHEWRSGFKQPSVQLLPSDAAFAAAPSQWFYVSVHAYKHKAAYQLLVTTFTPPGAASSSAAQINGSAASSSPLSSSPPSSASSLPSTSGAALGSASLPPSSAESSLCSNCRSLIPKKQFALHSVQCPRLSVYCPTCARVVRRSEWAAHAHCPTCQAVVHPDELQKHMDLLHSALRCACGEHVPVEQMAQHLADSCPLRLLACHYCAMQLPAKDLDAHLAYEAARSIQCSVCAAHVPRKRMNIHLAAVHSINPSLRPGDRSSMGRAMRSAKAAAEGEQADDDDEDDDDDDDDDMARALRQSRRDAGLPEEDDGGDGELQRALQLSSTEGKSSELTADDDELLTAEEADDALDVDVQDDWGENSGEDDQAAGEAEGDSGGAIAPAPSSAVHPASSASRGRSERAMCPYCALEHHDYDALIAHMQACDQMDD